MRYMPNWKKSIGDAFVRFAAGADLLNYSDIKTGALPRNIRWSVPFTDERGRRRQTPVDHSRYPGAALREIRKTHR